MTDYDWNHGSDAPHYLSVLCCKKDGHQQDHCYSSQIICNHKYCHCFIRKLLSDMPKHFTVYLFGLPNKTEAQSKVMCNLFPVNPWVCKRKQHIILNIFPVSIFHFNLIYQHYIFCKTHFRILTSVEVIYSVEFLQWHCHSPERFYQPYHKTPENISPSSSISHSLVF